MKLKISIIMMSLQFILINTAHAQSFSLFSHEVKRDYPSVLYDFLERYLYEIDSLQNANVDVTRRIKDDKVLFLTGNALTIHSITPEMYFSVNKTDNKYYEVSWMDTLNNVILDMAFPMQYELLLGKPKAEIETTFIDELNGANSFAPLVVDTTNLILIEDSCYETQPIANYYLESLNTAMFLHKIDSCYVPTFTEKDIEHSAANLFHGIIDSISEYTLSVEQNLYGFNKSEYTIPLYQWLAYCQAMKLTTYFAVEEVYVDGLKALVIAQSHDLGFNHLLSLLIPDNFVENKQSIIQCKMNAYIPTHNVKELYQQLDKERRKK